MHQTIRLSALGLAVIGAIFFGADVPAHAACIAVPGQPGTVLWSYPEDGASDVPVNARLWLRLEHLTARQALLNGEMVEFTRMGFRGIQIRPDLEPETAYELVLEGDPGQTPVTVKFKTGSSRAPDPKDPKRLFLKETHVRHGFPKDWSPFCTAILAGQDCFDTGQNTLISFEVEGADPIAWMVTNRMGNPGYSALWPAECGFPSVFTHSPKGGEMLFMTTPIGAGGVTGRGAMWRHGERKLTASTDVVACDGGEAPARRKIVELREPRVSTVSQRGKVTGDVLLRASVNPEGRVVVVEVLDDFVFELGSWAKGFVLDWRFAPDPTQRGLEQICLKTHFPGPLEK